MIPLFFLSPFCHTFIMGPRPQTTFLNFASDLKISQSFWWKRLKKLYQTFANTKKKAASSSTRQLTLTSRFQRVISTLGRKTFKTQPLPEPQPAQVRTNVLTWISENIGCWAMKMMMVMDGRSLTHHSQVQWPKYMQPQRHSTVWSLIDFNHSWYDQPHTCLTWQLWMVPNGPPLWMVHNLSSSSFFSDVGAVNAWFFLSSFHFQLINW